MKLNIKEIKEKAEVGDKLDFSAIVKKVYPMKKKDMPYAIGIQNITVKDDTDEITVSIFVKLAEDEFDQSIEGKKAQISGEYSTFQKDGKIYKNITKGKILIEGSETESKELNEKTNQISSQIPTGITEEAYKIELLKLGIDFAKEFGDKNLFTTETIIEIAEYFDKHYIRPEKPKEKQNIIKEAVYKAETLRKQKDSELTDEKAVLIGDINRLIEEKNGQTMVDRILEGQNVKTLEELEMPKLKAIYNSLEKMNNNVPF